MSEPSVEEEIDIMASLHQKKMYIIHKEFEKNPEGLVTFFKQEMSKFVDVMLNHLDYQKNQKMDITLALMDLFRVIVRI